METEFLIHSTEWGSDWIKNMSVTFTVYLVLQAGSCKHSYHLLNVY